MVQEECYLLPTVNNFLSSNITEFQIGVVKTICLWFAQVLVIISKTFVLIFSIPKNIRQHKLVKQKIVWDQIDNEKYNENITANLKDIYPLGVNALTFP
jgi:hypothetical protein